MFLEVFRPSFEYKTEGEKIAADIFISRLGRIFRGDNAGKPSDCLFIFKEDKSFCIEDGFDVRISSGKVIFTAGCVRGLIYGAGLFLRKSVLAQNKISLLYDINGAYSPEKEIRGHQLGFRPCSNTYDSWTLSDYRTYYEDLMLFTADTVEHIPYEKGYSNRNSLMKYDELRLIKETGPEARSLGLHLSLWYPNTEENEKEALENREKCFSLCPYIDSVFIPGSDPGSLRPGELFGRAYKISRLLKKYHPHSRLWISAQMPHDDKTWGEEFIRETEKRPDFLYGVIEGPNKAFEPEELRKRVPSSYPLRFYPDITHNIRCEYPVHYKKNDWDFAFAAVNGRESINPRPYEFRELFEETKDFFTGSVTYSEGVNDDINKALWSALSFDSSVSVRTVLEDYSRLYMPETDWKRAADGIEGLERNWEEAPERNESIEKTLDIWLNLGKENPELSKNWRYVSCLMRAETDAFVRRKVIFEKALIKNARKYTSEGLLSSALSILKTPLPENIKNLRKDIFINGEKLYNLIGMQLSVPLYSASGEERGAVLDTLDNPVTDRDYLVKKSENNIGFLKKYFLEKTCAEDEFHLSVALDGIPEGQEKDFYIDFIGDRTGLNNGLLPTEVLSLFDHFCFSCTANKLSDNEKYIMRAVYKKQASRPGRRHMIKINGEEIYRGNEYGRNRDRKYENDFLSDFYSVFTYDVPRGIIKNGTAFIEISEPEYGFQLASISLIKDRTEN